MTKLWAFIASLIGQIILAVVVVGLLAFFNPGDIFSSTKHTLKDTPILVRSMKEIGQLITAEYYGETVADNFTIIEIDSVEKEMELLKVLELHENFVSEIAEMRAIHKDLPRNKKKLEDHYLSNYSALTDVLGEELMLNYYLTTHDQSDRQTLLRYLIKTKRGREESVGDQKSIEDYLSNYYAQSVTPGKVKKKELLVIVGRGWVKAGYDFKKFKPENFIYSESQKRVYLSGMAPFMEVTMNPWFIPEKGVEGFEFIMMGKEAEHNRQTVLETKIKCKAKLMRQAEDREIFEKAKQNAEENIRAFISLMMDEEIASVHIYEGLIDAYWSFFMEDDTISADELRMIEREYLKNKFMDTLTGDQLREYESYEKYIPPLRDSMGFRYSKEGFVEEIAGDGLLDMKDQQYLSGFSITSFDSLWYGALKLEEELRSGKHIYLLRPQSANNLSPDTLENYIKSDLNRRIEGAQYRRGDTLFTTVDSELIRQIIENSLMDKDPDL